MRPVCLGSSRARLTELQLGATCRCAAPARSAPAPARPTPACPAPASPAPARRAGPAARCASSWTIDPPDLLHIEPLASYDAAKVEAAGDESVGIDWDSEPAEPEPKLPFIDFSASSWGDMSIEVLIAWKTFTYMAEEDVEAGVADAATYLVRMGAAAPPRGAASNVRALTAFRNNVIRKLAPRVARAFINRGSPASPGSGGSASGSVLCSAPTLPPSGPAASTVAALTGSASAGAPPLAGSAPAALPAAPAGAPGPLGNHQQEPSRTRSAADQQTAPVPACPAALHRGDTEAGGSAPGRCTPPSAAAGAGPAQSRLLQPQPGPVGQPGQRA